jgi:hypothetical protein
MRRLLRRGSLCGDLLEKMRRGGVVPGNMKETRERLKVMPGIFILSGGNLGQRGCLSRQRLSDKDKASWSVRAREEETGKERFWTGSYGGNGCCKAGRGQEAMIGPCS